MALDGKVALVTGGGTGIGAAIAQRLVAEGAKVCLAGRRLEPLTAVAESLPAGSAAVCRGDASRDEDAARMVAATLELGDRIDVLVNNHGISAEGAVADTDPEEWRRVLDVNLTGPFLLMRAALPHMIANGGGSIVNVASLGGMRCLPEMPAYCTSKAGLIMLTKQAALDYGPYNIRCNAVCPGATKTPMLEMELRAGADALGWELEQYLTMRCEALPLRRYAEPDEVAAACAFLCRDDASFITGTALLVDGGTAVVDVFGATPAPQ